MLCCTVLYVRLRSARWAHQDFGLRAASALQQAMHARARSSPFLQSETSFFLKRVKGRETEAEGNSKRILDVAVQLQLLAYVRGYARACVSASCTFRATLFWIWVPFFQRSQLRHNQHLKIWWLRIHNMIWCVHVQGSADAVTIGVDCPFMASAV